MFKLNCRIQYILKRNFSQNSSAGLGHDWTIWYPKCVFNGAIHLSTQNEICNAVELQVSVVHRSLVDHIHLVPSPIMVPYGTIIWYH